MLEETTDDPLSCVNIASLWFDLRRQFFAIYASKKWDFFSSPYSITGYLIEIISNYFASLLARFLLIFLMNIGHNES
jgi:hypothetical protein